MTEKSFEPKPNSYYMVVGLPHFNVGLFCKALQETYAREGRAVVIADNLEAVTLASKMNIDIIHKADNHLEASRRIHSLSVVPDGYAKIALYMNPPEGKEIDKWKKSFPPEAFSNEELDLILKHHKRPDLDEGFEAVLDVSNGVLPK